MCQFLYLLICLNSAGVLALLTQRQQHKSSMRKNPRHLAKPRVGPEPATRNVESDICFEFSTPLGAAQPRTQHSIYTYSRKSASHTAHHILLHPSSSAGPKHPVLMKLTVGDLAAWGRTPFSVQPHAHTQPHTHTHARAHTYTRTARVRAITQMILLQVHLQKPCYDFSFL